MEFEVEIGEYHGVVRVPRRVFQLLLPETPTPERCVEAYYLQRTRFERIAERKLRRLLNVAGRRRNARIGRRLPPPENPWLARLPLDDAAAVPRDARNQFAIAAPRFRGAAAPTCSTPTG